MNDDSGLTYHPDINDFPSEENLLWSYIDRYTNMFENEMAKESPSPEVLKIISDIINWLISLSKSFPRQAEQTKNLTKTKYSSDGINE